VVGRWSIGGRLKKINFYESIVNKGVLSAEMVSLGRKW